MEFKHRDQLENLLNAMRHSDRAVTKPLLLQADILPGDFDDFCREVLWYVDLERIDEAFEENLEHYIDRYFAGATCNWQREILTKILKKYDALEVDELNEILREAGIKYIKVCDVQIESEDESELL